MGSLETIRPELLTLSPEQMRALLPYSWVFGGTILTILLSILKRVSPKWPVFLFTVGTCIAGAIASIDLLHLEPISLFNGMMVSDPYANFFNVLFLGAAGFTALASFRYLDTEKLQYPEYYVLLLLSALGMMLMVSALDLIVIFIALELMSLAVYVLVGFRRTDRRSNEAAMKYFILGGVASAVFLYGSALLYGATGHTGLRAILQASQAHATFQTPIYILGALLVLVGFLFKVASFPFHMWMPDVYEGAPVPVTGFMTTGLKAAAFATLIRIFVSMGYTSTTVGGFGDKIYTVLWVIAVLTMVVGNFVALTQTNLKRMLAYSSIAHTGYLLVGVIAIRGVALSASLEGISSPGIPDSLAIAALVMYLVVYAIMNFGAFVVLTLLSGREDTGLSLNDFSGLSQRHPWLAFSMAVFLLSMAGIPLTGGFAAKYLLFYSAVQGGYLPSIALVVIAVLCSAVSVYYYLRVLVHMYMKDPSGSPKDLRVSLWSGFTVVTMVLLTFQIGIMPERMVEMVKKVVVHL